MGTSGYMSPEQLRGRDVDHRSDIFTFGAVLYEMLGGTRAFRGDTGMDIATAILKEDPPDLPAAERHIPAALTKIVDRCLEKNPAARFQSAGDLAFAIDAVSATSSGATTTMPAIASRRPRWMPWVAAGVLGIALGSAAAFVALRLMTPAAPAPTATAFPLTLPDNLSLVGGMFGGSSVASLAVSPDGRHIAFLGRQANCAMSGVRTWAAVGARTA